MAQKKASSAQQDPLFTEVVPQMPEGYYSGDQPNPHLRAFVEAHLAEKPYDPGQDTYEAAAFDKPIETTKATAIYNMHTYWSKKPHDAIQQYIEHYTQPGDLVLDSFCGSGGTALAALMSGRKAIAIDRSPAATFITKNYCTPVDINALKQAFKELKQKVQPEIDWLYETRCDRCDGPAMTAYTVYSQVFQCSRCLEKVPLFDCKTITGQTAEGKEKKLNICPYCYERGFEEVIRSQSQKFGAIPVLVSYICHGKCKPARDERQYNDSDSKKREYFSKYDLEKLQDIKNKQIPYWYPKGYDMQGFSRYQRDALYYYNVKEVADLFTKRNLWALAIILEACKTSRFSSTLLYVFQSNILNATRMQRYRKGGGGAANGTYYLPQLSIEREQVGCITRKFDDIISAQREIQQGLQTTEIVISTQSGTNLSALLTSSVDYIFTDPPYGDSIAYFGLSMFWNGWLRNKVNYEGEIIYDPYRNKKYEDYSSRMKKVYSELFRVLKDERYLSFTFHNRNLNIWKAVMDAVTGGGFHLVNVVYQEQAVASGTQGLNRNNTLRGDFVYNFKKNTKIKSIDKVYDNKDSKKEIVKKVQSWIKNNNGFLTSDALYEKLIPFIVEKNLYSNNEGQVMNIEDLLKQSFNYGQLKSKEYAWQEK